jgi:hypothetical protein
VSTALEAEWHDASVEDVAIRADTLVVALRIWVHDPSTRRSGLHPARLTVEAATVSGALAAGYEVLGGRVDAAEGRWDETIPVPFALADVTLRWNEGCGGPLAPITVSGRFAQLELTGPATIEETMP